MTTCVYNACVQCLSVRHLAVLVLIGVRVHKDPQSGEVVHVAEHRAWGKVQNVLEALKSAVADSLCYQPHVHIHI